MLLIQYPIRPERMRNVRVHTSGVLCIASFNNNTSFALLFPYISIALWNSIQIDFKAITFVYKRDWHCQQAISYLYIHRSEAGLWCLCSFLLSSTRTTIQKFVKDIKFPIRIIKKSIQNGLTKALTCVANFRQRKVFSFDFISIIVQNSIFSRPLCGKCRQFIYNHCIYIVFLEISINFGYSIQLYLNT